MASPGSYWKSGIFTKLFLHIKDGRVRVTPGHKITMIYVSLDYGFNRMKGGGREGLYNFEPARGFK